MPTPRAREVQIQLTEGEYIAARGKRTLTWLIRINDDWAHVSDWPGARIERCDAKAGTVWENRTSLTVPPGARLTRVESRPAAYPARDALDYLKRAPSQVPRRVFRQEFRVSNRGELSREP